MRKSPRGRMVFTCVGAVLALQWSLTAQAPVAAKRPLTYDVVDYWKSIQGTRLSDDGQWLAYATSAQREDGELVVRNLRTGQEFTHARGTSPTFTPDGKFVVPLLTAAGWARREEADAALNLGGGNACGGGPAPRQAQGRADAARRRAPRGSAAQMLIACKDAKHRWPGGRCSIRSVVASGP